MVCLKMFYSARCCFSWLYKSMAPCGLVLDSLSLYKKQASIKTQETSILWSHLQHHRWRLQEGWCRKEERGRSKHILCGVGPSVRALSEVSCFRFTGILTCLWYFTGPTHYNPLKSSNLFSFCLFQNNDVVCPPAHQHTCQVLVPQELPLSLFQGSHDSIQATCFSTLVLSWYRFIYTEW